MFRVGDRVYYPMHGVGIVEAIQEQMVLGKPARYYMLRFSIGTMTAMVPVETAHVIGLRPVINAGEADRVLQYLQQESCLESENWNQRYRENLDKLRQGDVYGVADVVKCLVRRDKEKGLSAGERKMYLTARHVLITELMAASGKEEEELKALVGKIIA